jgi:hypothetical protein
MGTLNRLGSIGFLRTCRSQSWGRTQHHQQSKNQKAPEPELELELEPELEPERVMDVVLVPVLALEMAWDHRLPKPDKLGCSSRQLRSENHPR